MELTHVHHQRDTYLKYCHSLSVKQLILRNLPKTTFFVVACTTAGDGVQLMTLHSGQKKYDLWEIDRIGEGPRVT